MENKTKILESSVGDEKIVTTKSALLKQGAHPLSIFPNYLILNDQKKKQRIIFQPKHLNPSPSEMYGVKQRIDLII